MEQHKVLNSRARNLILSKAAITCHRHDMTFCLLDLCRAMAYDFHLDDLPVQHISPISDINDIIYRISRNFSESKI